MIVQFNQKPYQTDIFISSKTPVLFKNYKLPKNQLVPIYTTKKNNYYCFISKSQNFKNIGQQIGKIKSYKNNIHLNTTNEQNIIDFLLGYNETAYTFNKYKSNKQKIKTHHLNLINIELSAKIKSTLKLISATNYVKDLVNTPPDDKNPEILSLEPKKLKLEHTVINEKKIKKLGLNLLYSVGKGSGKESKLVILKHLKANKKAPTLMLVGKGVTFDAGGLNLKPTNNIETMKMDMAGAATVLGLFKLIQEEKLKINIIGLIPLTENLVGHEAYKPGDILKAYNGKTVEIINTDAEGRLILADTISYGIKNFKPDAIVDLATLTGACIMALGYCYSGFMTNNKNLKKLFLESAKISKDHIWPLPLNKTFRNAVKSKIADYKNLSPKTFAGSSMGAAFLEKFVEDIDWAHLDIAGSAFNEHEATGRPIHLLYEFIKKWISTSNTQ